MKSNIPTILICIFTVIAVAGLFNLKISPDNRILLDPSDKRVAALSEFESEFRVQNSIAIVVRCQTIEESCKESLPATITSIHEQAYSIPFATRVDSLSNFPVIRSTEGFLESKNFFDAHCSPSCPTGLFKQSHPKLVERFANRAGTTMGVYVALNFDTESTNAVFDIQSAVLKIVNETNTHHNATIHYVGRVPLMHAFVDATVSEITGTMGIASLLIVLLLVLSFGSIYLALVSLCLSISTILATMGLAGWFGLVVSTATAALPTIILTLTTATAMHYFMHIVRVLSEDPNRDQSQVAFGAVASQFTPIVITSCTTIVAMLSMLLVESPPIRDLGLWIAVSLPICCTYLFLVVPALVANIRKIRPSKWQIVIQPLLNQHARLASKRTPVILLAVLVSVIAAANLSQLKIEDDFVRYFGSETRFRTDAEIVANSLIGPTGLEIVIDSGTENGVFNPAFLEQVAALETTIRQLQDVDSVYSIIDILDIFGPHFSSEHWQNLDDIGIAQIIFGYEMSLEEGQSTNDLLNSSASKMRVSIVAADIGSSGIQVLENSLRSLLKKSTLTGSVTGEAIPLAHLSTSNIPNLVTSLILSVFGVSIFLGFFFKSPRLGFVLFSTTLVPIISGFGIWTFFEPSIGLAAIVILSVCVGVVIDDTVHLIYRYQDGIERLGLEPSGAASYAVHRVGNAITTTTLILVLGFGVLIMSSFKVNSTFGACTAIILTTALTIDLFILPSLLTFKAESGGKH